MRSLNIFALRQAQHGIVNRNQDFRILPRRLKRLQHMPVRGFPAIGSSLPSRLPASTQMVGVELSVIIFVR